MSDQFKLFCWQLNIDQAITSSYHLHSNGQVEACKKVVMCTIKNALTTIMMSICFLADTINAERYRVNYSS